MLSDVPAIVALQYAHAAAADFCLTPTVSLLLLRGYSPAPRSPIPVLAPRAHAGLSCAELRVRGQLTQRLEEHRCF
jgi:hypothetical protein